MAHCSLCGEYFYRERRLALRDAIEFAESLKRKDRGLPDCERCNDTGWVMVRNSYPMSYVGPGPCQGHETGVCDAPCECGRAHQRRLYCGECTTPNACTGGRCKRSASPVESFRSHWSKEDGEWVKTDEIRF